MASINHDTSATAGQSERETDAQFVERMEQADLWLEETRDHLKYDCPDDLDRLIALARIGARVTEPSGDDGWRDIASAPKDGTEFCAYENGDVYKCNWEQYEDECRYYAGWFNHASESLENPTRWRPLPSPPSKQETV